MKLFKVEYLGFCTVNKRLTNPMIPWIIAEIKKNKHCEKVNIIICFIQYIPTTVINTTNPIYY